MKGIDLANALGGLLSWQQRRRLDELAPTHLEVPSGSRIRLDYYSGESPVLAVRVQEMFGCADTPRITGGRQPLLVKLLSPAGRPVQVTQDLAGFWAGSYNQVQADIISIHIPLDETTHHFVGEHLLKLMRPRELLVNTARGAIIDAAALMRLLKTKEIAIHLALDVYEDEPIPESTLNEFRKIAAERPDLRFIFTPHSATADADTRARMSATMLANLNSLVRSQSVRDVKELNLIPPLLFVKKEPRMLDDYRIFRWWQGK